MIAELRLHEQVQHEIELLDSMFHWKRNYPQYGKNGLTVIIFTEHIKPGTILERYVNELEAYLERNNEKLSNISVMTIIGNSKYVE